jgi:hypothetical protein
MKDLHAPQLSRRQFVKLSLAAAALASTPVVARSAAAQAAAEIDESSPIGKKWIKLGGQDGLGAATSEPVTTPDGAAQYQTFAKGVIVYSDDWGAMLLSPTIFQKWLALNAVGQARQLHAALAAAPTTQRAAMEAQAFVPLILGAQGDEVASARQLQPALASLLSYVGFPTQDFVSEPGLEIGYFERGMIIAPAAGEARLIYGFIYDLYLGTRDLLGLPLAEEADAAGGGRLQRFERGDIYWRDDMRAHAVSGAIRQRWLATGGSGGPLGYPRSEEQALRKDDAEIGRVMRFEHGSIYYSPTTGAWDITSALQPAYERDYGGPAGWLGFPVGGTAATPTSGGFYNDFQHGVLVAHSAGSYKGVVAFRDLTLHVTRFEGDQTDCVLGICGDADVYVQIDITASNGTAYTDLRRPSQGTYDGGADVDERFPLAARVQGDLLVTVRMRGREEDDGPDDTLGTIERRYSVDNVWGFFEDPRHEARDDGRFVATYRLQSDLPYNRRRFRQEMFWSFRNFSTPKLSYDLFAATFSDVDLDESAFFHPYNRIFYDNTFEDVADGGNCFGMALEAVYALVNRSLYSQPINRFWPDTQNGGGLDPNNSTHAGTIKELNIKQAYQLGEAYLDWKSKLEYNFLTGENRQRDAVRCFRESREAFERGDFPLLSIRDRETDGRGHAVLPYRWDDSNPTRWTIFVADPNNPANAGVADTDPACRVDIDPLANSFRFAFAPGDVWTGDAESGGLLHYTPFHILNETPDTPYDLAWLLLTVAVIVILGENTQTRQLDDGAGKSYYRTDLSAAPSLWEHVNLDPATRLPGLARHTPTDASGAGPVPYELYYGRGGGTFRHAILPAADAAPDATLEYVLNSGTLSTRALIPGTPGIADIITSRNLGAREKSIAVTIPAESQPKAVAWTLSGPEKQRWLELTELKLIPGQTIAARLKNGGFEASFANDGPTTTALLRVRTGGKAPVVDAGLITIEGYATTEFAFDAPRTTLTYTGGTPGKNGWLLSPVTITLTAQDHSGSGVAYTEYSKDGRTWTRYTGPFRYADEGETTLYFRSKDNDNNQEGAKTRVWKIDTRPPTSSLRPLLNQHGLSFSYVVTDPTPGSGPARMHYIAKGAGAPLRAVAEGGAATVTLTGEFSDLEFWGEDVAGNQEAARHTLRIRYRRPELAQLSDYQALGDKLGSRDPSHGLKNLVDVTPPGNHTSSDTFWRWVGYPKAVALQVDLGTAQTLGALILFSHDPTKAPDTRFQYSQDAKRWSDLPGLSHVDTAVGYGPTFYPAASITARYVRLVIDNTTYLNDIGYYADLQLALLSIDNHPVDSPSAPEPPTPHRLPIARASASRGDARAVLDGRPATAWVADGQPRSAQLTLDLGRTRSITAIRYFATASAVAYHTTIAISSDPGFPNDPAKTTTVARDIYTGGSGIPPASRPAGEPAYGAHTIDNFGVVGGRYVRVAIDNPEGNALLGGYGELDVYGY